MGPNDLKNKKEPPPSRSPQSQAIQSMTNKNMDKGFVELSVI